MALQQLTALTQSTVGRQLALIVGIAAAIALGITLVNWGREPSYGVLYTGLSTKDAGAVVDNLRQKKIDYKLDENTGAIMVPTSKVHELRLQLAGEGVPQSSGVGFNILEQKQEFGTSQFLENARYQRALEEELARTITSVNNIESARVHLALPKQSVFVRRQQEPSASVLLRLYPGRSLETEQVAAISHLVAASIPNLEPGRVTVVDQKGRLLNAEKQNTEVAASSEQFDYTRKIEDSVVLRIEDILAPIVGGRDAVRAQVSADMDFAVTEQTQETYNPDTPALRSEQRYEQVTPGEAGAAGIPGALSNEPPATGRAPERATAAAAPAPGTPAARQAAAATPAPAPAENTVKRTTANYELDHTVSHTKLASGQVKRLSVAVVVDDKVTTGADGALVRTARTPEEVERMLSLVKDAVGYNPQRGDTVNVINASFTEAAALAPLPEAPLWKQAWVWDTSKQVLAYLVAAALVGLVLLTVMRSFASLKSAEPAPAMAGGPGLANDQLSLTSNTPTVHLPGPDQTYEENLNQARQMALQDPKRVAQVVRSWIAADQ
jgi:flagellar M-ring protein FliF